MQWDQKFLLKVLKDWRHQPNLKPLDARCQRRIKNLHRPHLRAQEQVILLPVPL